MRMRFALLLIATTLAASSAAGAEDLSSVMTKLNASAAKFKSKAADFKFETVQTDPVPDTEVQTGTVYYERKSKGGFQMAAHIQKVDGKPVPKAYIFSNGVLRLWEGGNLDQVTTFAKASKFESYLSLGFGASGKDLEDKWTVKYDGDETIAGVKTAKLELVAKDPEVRKNLPKVTIWVDTDRDVSMKQVFDEGQGQTRTCTYSNFKMNQSLPGNAFAFKTDKDTRYLNR